MKRSSLNVDDQHYHHAAIWWIRRDLRLSDNLALSTALQHAEQVLPVFILDPKLVSSGNIGEKRLSFLYEGLRALDASLQKRGSYLTLRSGNPENVLTELLNQTAAGAIYAEEDYSPYAVARDRKINKSLPLTLLPGLTVNHPNVMLKGNQTPYTVYTPFNKAWQARPWPGELSPAPLHIPTPPGYVSEAIPGGDDSLVKELFPAGEAEAQRRLNWFIDSQEAPIFDYQNNRNRVDLAGTSSLSSYLRFGMLSAKQAVAAARQAIARAEDPPAIHSAETWLNELVWREFYLSIMFHFPEVRLSSFQQKMKKIRWLNNEGDFTAWKEGRTGYPIVDAAMRQLVQIGWMHNRARMIVASFLTKDLLIDWRWGETYFMQHLIDGDPAINNGGWQWVAGTGTDAAPYFRIFNPVLQSQKFDPKGEYIRRFVPELVRVADKFIHEPWKIPVSLQEDAGCIIGKDYPTPIVDHAFARERALSSYRVN